MFRPLDVDLPFYSECGQCLMNYTLKYGDLTERNSMHQQTGTLTTLPFHSSTPLQRRVCIPSVRYNQGSRVPGTSLQTPDVSNHAYNTETDVAVPRAEKKENSNG